MSKLLLLAILVVASFCVHFAVAEANNDDDNGNRFFYWHNWVDSNNVSHLTRCEFSAWTAQTIADNSPTVFFDTSVAAFPANHVILKVPVGSFQDWHKDPFPQFVYWLNGKGRITTQDGATHHVNGGDLYFGEDQLATLGHISQNIGDEVIHLAAVQFRGLQPSRNRPCWAL